MDDTKRIVVAVEAGDAMKVLDNVKGSVQEVTAAKNAQMRITRAQVALEKAETASMVAAQKAYAAELDKIAKLKEINKAKKTFESPEKIAKLKDEYKKLADQYERLNIAEEQAGQRAALAKQNLDHITDGVMRQFNAQERARKGITKYSGAFSSLGRAIASIIPGGNELISAFSATARAIKSAAMAAGTLSVALGVLMAAAGVLSLLYAGYKAITNAIEEKRERQRQAAKENIEMLKEERQLLEGETSSVVEAGKRWYELSQKKHLSAKEKAEKNILDDEMSLYVEKNMILADYSNPELLKQAVKRSNESAIDAETEAMNRAREMALKESGVSGLLKNKSNADIMDYLSSFSKDALSKGEDELAEKYRKALEFAKEAYESEKKTIDLRKKALEDEKKVQEIIDKKYNEREAARKKFDSHETKLNHQQYVAQLEAEGKLEEAQKERIKRKYDEMARGLTTQAEFDRFDANRAKWEEQEFNIWKQKQSPRRQDTEERFLARFQETAQRSVRADSLEAIRLQSRVSYQNKMNIPQKQLEESKRQTASLEIISAGVQRLVSNAGGGLGGSVETWAFQG